MSEYNRHIIGKIRLKRITKKLYEEKETKKNEDGKIRRASTKRARKRNDKIKGKEIKK